MQKKARRKKILLTGGHAATTALATVEELLRRQKENNWEIIWVGPRFAVEGKKFPSLESQVFAKVGITSHYIIAGRLQRKFTLWTIPSLVKVPFGFLHAAFHILKLKPSVVVSFGGYAALPVVIAAWLKRVPVLIHEQTASAGLANRISAFFADRVCLAKAESKVFFSPKKVVVTGNPVMTQIAEIEPKQNIGKPPVIFITGGSRGSVSINDALLEILAQLLTKYKVIHLTGEHDFARFVGIKNKNYEVYSWIDPLKIDNIYRQADMVVARAGANTVSEIMIAKRPALLIPIPWSYLDEQRKNAQNACDFGIARILDQDDLTGKRLLTEIAALFKNWDKMVAKVRQKTVFDAQASGRLVEQILTYL